jgi:ABC-type lipoprotein release transport system permease subunit
VIEKSSIALARAEARQKAEQDAKADLQQAEEDAAQALLQEKQGRAGLKQHRATLISVTVPSAIVLSALWIGFLTLNNVQHRRAEIGLLRALGLRSSQILGIFIAKAAVWGSVGAALGVAVGLIAGMATGTRLEGIAMNSVPLGFVIQPLALIVVLLVSPIVAMLASWLPALSAAQQDPALVLREE